jgi:hypothetical protein
MAALAQKSSEAIVAFGVAAAKPLSTDYSQAVRNLSRSLPRALFSVFLDEPVEHAIRVSDCLP